MTGAMRGALLLLTRWRVERQGALPSGPLIIVSNHLSLADPPLLAASLPRRVRFLAKRELFSIPVVGLAVRLYGAIPLSREAVDRQALAQAEAWLRAGGALALFPEGTRSRDAILGQGKPGVGYLALRTGAPLVPVAITGTEGLLRPWQVLRRPLITVRVGEPFTVGGRVESPQKQETQACTDAIMVRVAALLPEDRRGTYQEQPRTGQEQPRTGTAAPFAKER
jgi:1-acyl-sn-glycerol-3-phosphate acyltransferase